MLSIWPNKAISGESGDHYLEVPLAGMGAAGDSHGQSCEWGLHCFKPVSYGSSSVTQTGSALQEFENNITVIYQALPKKF